MNNIYITEATTDDIQNDQWILLEIRGKITDAIHHAQKLQKKVLWLTTLIFSQKPLMLLITSLLISLHHFRINLMMLKRNIE